MTDEEALFKRFAALVPCGADTVPVADFWDIGEQEAGLDVIVRGLRDHRIPITETARAELSALTEVWGVRERLAPALAECVAAGEPGGEAGPPRLRLLTGAPPQGAGALVVPWIACGRCDEVLARVYDEDDAFMPEQYAVFAPGGTRAPEVFAWTEDHAVWSALAALSCAGRR